MLVTKKLGADKAIQIDWKNPRVICIAESYNPYDIFALNEISAKLELYRYHYYENHTFTLENVKGDDEKPKLSETIVNQLSKNEVSKDNSEVSVENHINKAQPFIQELFLKLKSKIFELDENIQQKTTSAYIGYRVSKTFAEVHIQKSRILIYLRPLDYYDPEGKVSKVPDTHNWVLNRRVYIDNEDNIDYVINLIEQSYKDVL
jgi:predicted transport protein